MGSFQYCFAAAYIKLGWSDVIYIIYVYEFMKGSKLKGLSFFSEVFSIQ